MQTFYFSLSVKYDYCERFYEPGFNTVVMTDDNGKRIQLPVLNLRPFVGPTGLHGRFRLTVGDNNKIKEFVKVN